MINSTKTFMPMNYLKFHSLRLSIIKALIIQISLIIRKTLKMLDKTLILLFNKHVMSKENSHLVIKMYMKKSKFASFVWILKA